MRLTYRTVRVLMAIDALGGRGSRPSNRQVATAAGISDPGQISKLLARLQALDLVGKTGGDHAKGEPNAWALTPLGRDVTRTLQGQSALTPRANRRAHVQANQRSRNARYRRINALVELSWPRLGSASLCSSGTICFASALPSSTPHWSKELIPQIAPWVNTLCS